MRTRDRKREIDTEYDTAREEENNIIKWDMILLWKES